MSTKFRLPDGRTLVLSTLAHAQVGTGGVVWQPSASALCRWLATNTELKGCNVLELGTGTGVCGLYAAVLGASRVLLTDHGERPALLDLARNNANMNAGLFRSDALDVLPLTWGRDEYIPMPEDGSNWKLVIGSDITYTRDGMILLCETVGRLLCVSRCAPRVVLAHQHRPDCSHEDLIAIATDSGLVINELSSSIETACDSQDPLERVYILELSLPLPTDYPGRECKLPEEEHINVLHVKTPVSMTFRTAPHDQAVGSGGIIWPSARIMCKWIGMQINMQGRRVLELGAGAGACGIFAAAMGASRVLLTDDGEKPGLLELAHSNIRLNSELFPSCWIDVDSLLWGTSTEAATLGPWDVVLVSDATYVEQGTRLLCQTIKHLLLSESALDARPQVIVAHQDREGSTLEALTSIANECCLHVREIIAEYTPSLQGSRGEEWDEGCDADQTQRWRQHAPDGPCVLVFILELSLALPSSVDQASPELCWERLALPGYRSLVLRTMPHSEVGTGGAVWQSARAMCRWLNSISGELQECSVLELGSGTGACGLYAAALGASHVLLTDDGERPSLLELARSNARFNASLYACCEVHVSALSWGSTATALHGEHYDLIIGSDLTHLAKETELLCRTVLQLIRREGGFRRPRVVLAHQVRSGFEGTLQQLNEIAAAAGLVANLLLTDQDPSDGYPPVPVAIVQLEMITNEV